jgi:hypothetical protein
MKINATRSRRFIVVSKDADDKGSATEFGASKEEACAGMMAFGFQRSMQAEGFHNQRVFVINATTGETIEHMIDRNNGRASTKPAEPITNVYT